MLTILFDKSIHSHRALLAEIKNWTAGATRIPPHPDYAANPRACELGQWIETEHAAAVLQAPRLTEIRALHDELHLIVARILDHAPTPPLRDSISTDIATLEDITARLIGHLKTIGFGLFNPQSPR
jgi:hypothetical protein